MIIMKELSLRMIKCRENSKKLEDMLISGKEPKSHNIAIERKTLRAKIG